MLRLLHDGMYAMIVEQPPSTRTTIVNKKKYHLPFPYMVFALSTQKSGDTSAKCNFYALGSTKPVKTPEDEVFTLPLPNTYSNGVICLNYDIPLPDFTGDECEWNLRKYIDLFWTSPYETGGVSHGDKRWELALDQWKQPTFNPHNIRHWTYSIYGAQHTETHPLKNFFGKSPLQDPLDPRFTDETIGELAAKVKALQYWRADEECWLLAEQGIANSLSCQ